MTNIVSTTKAKYEKYKSVLSYFNKKDRYDLIKIFDKSIEYIKDKYADKDIEEKASAVYVVKESWRRDESFKFDNIEKIIDEFLEYREKLSIYVDSLVIMQTIFDAEITYYDSFVSKKIKKDDKI